jgi:hypothetical protein
MLEVEKVTTTQGTGDFWSEGRENTVTPCHGGDQGFKSPRGRQLQEKDLSPLIPLDSYLLHTDGMHLQRGILGDSIAPGGVK